MDDNRPDPDALLAAAARDERGRLKVFLGAAPGVGKTWEMLVQARRRQAEGADVLAGVIETHGRAETEAQMAGLPLLPRRAVPYRGQVLHEFDLDAALARRPGLLLVDELAHTNAPGSRHNKRWEDVEELLAAGIDVWATLNVQHLESLNDDVARITGVRVAETLPDRVLEGADEIEVMDVPPAELRARLQSGRIYRPDVARRALDGFFREGNLAALREIALRRAAAHVDDDLRDWLRERGVAGPTPASDRVMILVGPDGGAEAVVRHAKRLADALHAPWAALHVERPRTDSVMSARAPLALAEQLGAAVEQRAGADLVQAVLDAARVQGTTHLVMGRGPATLWRRALGRTLSAQLLRRAPDFALHVVPVLPDARRKPAPPRAAAGWEPWLAAAYAVGAVAAVTAGLMALDAVLPPDAIGMVYLAVVVGAASRLGLWPALAAAAAAFLAWDYLFIPPVYTLTIGSTQDLVGLVVFALVAVLVGSLAGRVRAEARASQARIEGLRRIAAFSRSLGEPTTEPDLLSEIARQGAAAAGGPAVLLSGGGVGAEDDTEDLAVQASEPPGAAQPDARAMAAARWAWEHGRPAGRGTSTLPSADWRFLPLRTTRGRLAVLGVQADDVPAPKLQALETLADQAALALERVRLAARSARAAALEETQRLRTALLASLSHDLRTPLAGIQGAASTLRGAWDTLPGTTRADLLESIEQDVGRMAGFLANITDLTRLESGDIRPRLAPVPVAEVLDAAVARLPGKPLVVPSLPDPTLAVLADPALLEQALFNVFDNAVKYAPPDAPLLVRAATQGNEVAIVIADEGMGIAAADLPHVFDSFYRVHRADRTQPGTGLGLAIARGMVEAMGGRIEAASPRPDLPADGAPGTAVTIRLPRAP